MSTSGRGSGALTYDLADLFRGRQIDAEILDELETRLLVGRDVIDLDYVTSAWRLTLR